MDPSSTANVHDILGPGSCEPTTGQVRGWESSNSHTLKPGPTLRQHVQDRRALCSGSSPSSTSGDVRASSGTSHVTSDTESLDRARRSDAARDVGTQMGIFDSRIPTARETRDQLEAARSSELPVGPSRTAETHPSANDGTSSSTLTDQPSPTAHNYTREDVLSHKKAYIDETGHVPAVFSHERQTAPAQGDDFPYQVRDFANGPDLPIRTSQGAGGGLGGDDRTAPGSSMGRKVQGAFAQVHVRGDFL